MLVAELQELEEVKNLVTRGQQLGVLTFGDVSTAVAEVDLDESDIEDLYGHIEKQGIELVEDVDPALKANAAKPSPSVSKLLSAVATSSRSGRPSLSESKSPFRTQAAPHMIASANKFQPFSVRLSARPFGKPTRRAGASIPTIGAPRS